MNLNLSITLYPTGRVAPHSIDIIRLVGNFKDITQFITLTDKTAN